MFGLTPYNRENGSIIKKPRDLFEIENFFENFFDDSYFPTLYNKGRQMRVDIRESEREYIVEAELPGINKSEININLINDILTISVERNHQTSEEGKNYIKKERRYGSISRTFTVSNIINENVVAKFENGVLTITLPRKETGISNGMRIEIS